MYTVENKKFQEIEDALEYALKIWLKAKKEKTVEVIDENGSVVSTLYSELE